MVRLVLIASPRRSPSSKGHPISHPCFSQYKSSIHLMGCPVNLSLYPPAGRYCSLPSLSTRNFGFRNWKERKAERKWRDTVLCMGPGLYAGRFALRRCNGNRRSRSDGIGSADCAGAISENCHCTSGCACTRRNRIRHRLLTEYRRRHQDSQQQPQSDYTQVSP